MTRSIPDSRGDDNAPTNTSEPTAFAPRAQESLAEVEQHTLSDLSPLRRRIADAEVLRLAASYMTGYRLPISALRLLEISEKVLTRRDEFIPADVAMILGAASRLRLDLSSNDLAHLDDIARKVQLMLNWL